MLNKSYLLVVYICILLITVNDIYCDNIIWEKCYKEDSLKYIGMNSEIKRYDNILFIGYEGFNSSKNRNNIGILKLDFNGNILNRKEFFSAYEYVLGDFQKYDNRLQILCNKADGWVGMGCPAVFIYLNDTLEIIEETKLSQYSFSINLNVSFYKDSVYSYGETGKCINGMSIFDRNMNYVTYRLIDTSGFNYPNNYSYSTTFRTILTKDSNMLWIFPQYSNTDTISSYMLAKTDNCCNIKFKTKYFPFDNTINLNGALIDKMVETNDGGSIMLGITMDSTNYITGYLFVKHNKNGVFEWHKLFKINTYAAPQSIKMLSNGNFIIVADTYFDYYNRTFSYWVFNSQGDLIDSCSWSRNKFNVLLDAIEKDNGNILVYGYTRVYSSKDEFIDSLYLAEINYKGTDVEEFKKDGLSFRIIPNPANNTIEIQGLNEYFENKIEIFNPTGIVIYENSFVNKINISNFPSGVYFIKISNSVQKFVKL